MSEEFSFWISCIVDGIANGFVYGLLGLCLVLIFRANKLFNFSQTQVVAALMIMSAIFVKKGMDLYLVILLGLGIAFVIGLSLHLGVMRLITERKNSIQSGEVIATFGLATLFDGLSGFLFSDAPEPFPSMFGEGTFSALGIAISNNSLGIIGLTTVLMFFMMLFFRFTKSGLLMEAVSENILAARLRGIRASNILALAWGLTTMLAMMGGVLIAPVLFVYPQMFGGIFGYSLIAVVIGGFESFFGAVLGGVLIGVLENVSANVVFIGSELKFAPIFALLIFVLLFKPRGLFGKADIRRI